VPPVDAVQWTRGANSANWAAGGNWQGDTAPGSGKDVLFGNAPSGNNTPEEVVQDTANLAVRSLWFRAGRDYTLKGTGSLVLGGGLADGGAIITVLRPATTGATAVEHNIDLALRLGIGEGRTAEIANYSGHALRLGGGLDFGNGPNAAHLRMRGGNYVHLAGRLSGAGNLTVATDAGHVVLSANNAATWTGKTEVRNGFLVVTRDGALGATSGAVAVTGAGGGASLAFRPMLLGGGVDYTTAQAITVSGTGYARPWGSADTANAHSALKLSPVGAIYNDGGRNHFAGAITLAGDTWLGSRDGTLRLSGAIKDGGAGYAVTKVGRGLIELANGGNAWSGTTTLSAGTLRLTAAASGLANSALVFAGVVDHENGGVLELGAGDFVRTLGSGAGQVIWKGDGGFSAYGADRKVTLTNSGGADAALTWGDAGGFVPRGSALLFGSAYSDAAVDFTNRIELVKGSLNEVRVTRGTTAASRGILSGILGGDGGLLKTGDGTLWLTNKGNLYRGATVIRSGVLGGRVPEASNIQFKGKGTASSALAGDVLTHGGVLGLDADFTRKIGTDSGQVYWALRDTTASGYNEDHYGKGYSGGFAAYGVARWVRLNNDSNTKFTFNDTNSILEKSFLIFGAPDSDATVRFDNPINFKVVLSNKLRVGNNIRVIAGTDVSRSVVVFNQALNGGNNQDGDTTKGRVRDLHFWGDGRADIIRANDALYIEFVGARGTDLRLSGDGSLLGLRDKYPLEAWYGGSITFDNSGTWNAETGGKYIDQRAPKAASIALYAGGFRYWGRNDEAANSVSTAAQLRLSIGANYMDMRNYKDKNYSRFSFQSIMHADGDSEKDGVYKPGDYHATINFISGNDKTYVKGEESGVQVRFRTQPDHVGGIIPYATVKGQDWARTEVDGGWHYITAYTHSNPEKGAESGWTTSTNASPSSNVTLSDHRTINSLRLDSGRTVDLGGRTLRLNSGGLLAVGDKTTSITNGTLTQGTNGGQNNNNLRTLYAHVYNTADVGLEISATLNLSAPTGRPAFVKTGEGTLLLSGTKSNSITGTTYVSQGTLALGKTGGATALGGRIIVGDYAGRDTLRLDRNEQIDNKATVRLRGGHPDPAQHLMAEGILQFNGKDGLGLRETFAKLEIEGRGVIDFAGGSVGHANYLILNDLWIDLDVGYYTASTLFIRNWFEGEDFLLVSKRSGNLTKETLGRIEFEGYGPAMLRDWNTNFYQITPMPEPATYGAILGAVGLGLFAWRKHRNRRRR